MADIVKDEIEITELVDFTVTRVDGVASPANGFPVLMMKGLPRTMPVAEPAVKADGSHAPFTGSHSHEHPAFGGPDGDGDGDHEHDHSHDGDADHHHSHAAKAAEFDREAAKALVKAIVGRKVDESPDIAGGTAVLAQIADLIIAEAQELKAGQAGEICDIQQLACAAEMIWCWRTGEEAAGSGSVMPATALMQSAAKSVDWTDEQWAAWTAELEKAIPGARLLPPGDGWIYPAGEVIKDSREFSAAERKKHAAAGNALPDGSYPVPDADALRRAAILARSKHGDWKAAERLIARRARELGVRNPLDDDDKDDASKSQIAKGDATVDTGAQGTGDLAKVVEDAVTKATASLRDELGSVREELAKVKATPVPGGPVLSRNVQVKQPGSVAREDWAAKAARYRELAEQVTDRTTADGYRKLAREADEKAVTPPAS